MNLKKILKDYFVSWFKEPSFDYAKLSRSTKQTPIELSGRFDYGRALGLYRYDSTVNKTLLGEFMYRFKYKNDEKCGVALSEYLYDFMKTEGLFDIFDIITIVPKASVNRNFLPMRFIVDQFDEAVLQKFQPELLICKKNNQEMKKTAKDDDKQKDLENRFAVNETIEIENMNIIIIDDIYNSGTTLNACNDILRKAGANQIMAITVTSVGRKTSHF